MGFFSCQLFQKSAKLKPPKSLIFSFMRKYWKKISLALIIAILFGASGFYYLKNFPGAGIISSVSAYNLNQKIRFGQDMHLEFIDEMDTKSVEENLILPDGFEANLNWEDNKNLIIEPKNPTQEGELYFFTVQRSAQKLDGNYLGEDLVYRFEIAGAPEIISRIPAPDSTNISENSDITLIFDRPVAPLSAVQGDNSVFNPEGWNIQISPSVSGKWRWVGTSAVKFEPQNPLTLATEYSVTIPAGISVQNNDKTDSDFSFSFETERPKVVSVNPYEGSSSVGSNPEIQITFNQKIDLNSLKSNAILKSADQSYPAKKAQYYQYEQTYVDDNGEEKTDTITDDMTAVLTFENLPLDTDYTLTLPEGILGTEGKLGMAENFVRKFSTVGKFEVISAKYLYGGVYLDFSNPLPDGDLKQYFHFTPEPVGWEEEVEIEANSWNEDELSIYANFNPSTEYTLKIDKNFTDKFSQKLAEDYTYKFTTPELDPEIYLYSKGNFSVFEKTNPTTFYINALNVSQVEIDFAYLSLDEFTEIQKQKDDQYDFVPDLTKLETYQHTVLTNENPKNSWKIFEYDPFAVQSFEPKSGIYAMIITAPEWYDNYDKKPYTEQQYFALTDTALTLKYASGQALVWASDMQTGQGVANAQIEFLNANGEVILTGKTGLDGIFETKNFNQGKFSVDEYDYWNPSFWVTASTSDDFAFISNDWNSGLNPWNFGMSSNFRGTRAKAYRTEGYIYTDRNLYRAGDTVGIKGIVRLRDKLGQLSVPQNKEAKVTIYDPEYNSVLEETVKLGDYGSFFLEYPSASEAMLGTYDINIILLPEENYDNNYLYGSFQIQAYKKPEYSVEVNFSAEDYYQNDELQAEISGAYYFGAPMSNADVDWRVQTTDYFFNRYTGDEWYSFSLEDNWCWYDCGRGTEMITKGENKLDTAGNLTVKLPIDISEQALSQVFTLEADITDENNQIVSNRTSVPVHKAGVYVGITPEQYIVTPDTPANIKLIALNPQGETIANQDISLTLFKRTWNSIRKKNIDGEYYYENEPNDEKISDLSVKTNKQGESIAQINIPEGGNYRVLATVKDSQGREAVADTSLYAWSTSYVNFAQPNSDKIEIIADKKEYAVGDTATLMVKSPYQGNGVKMLFTLERENIIEQKVVDLSANAQPIKFEITENMIPNIYASAVIIKPRQGQTFDENGADTGAPAFKIGYTELSVETANKDLNVQIKTNKSQYKPGEEVKATIIITDAGGNPVRADVSLATVDLSVLALTGFQLPDLVSRFYTNQGLGVLTSQSLIYLAEYFKPGTKGGGGGSADTDARENFKDTAYWNPNIRTGSDGKAEVAFALPDNLTTWKLIAIANDKSSNFGAQAEEILETKDVILRSVKPRFAVVNDEIELGAIVHNFTSEQRNFEIKLTGSGFQALENDTTSVTIDPDGQAKVIFPVKITQTDEVNFDLKTTSGDYSDHLIEQIPVYNFTTEQTVATAGQTTDERMHESIYTPDNSEITEGKIIINVAPTLMTYLSGGLEYLINYPYGCAEQTASAVLANYIAGQYTDLGLVDLTSEETSENIITGLAKLYTLQRWDGGFGYWQTSSQSNPYLTAYILSVMHQVGTADKEVMARANKYLDNVLHSTEESQKLSLVEKTYILHTMSKFGKIDTSFLVNILEKRDELPLFAKAELAMIYKKYQNDVRAKDLLQDIKNSVKFDARGAHFEEEGANKYRRYMQDNTRSTAIIMQAMLEITPDDELLPNMTRWLLTTRQDGIWKNTQTTSEVLTTILAYLEKTKELDADFAVDAVVANATSLSANFNSENILSTQEAVINLTDLEQTQLIGVDFEKSGTGTLYYDILMNYLYTAEEIAPTEQGIGIQSEILPVGENDPNNLKVGQNYKIKLTMTVPEDRYYVGVESMLPAGFEPINISYQTTAQIDLDEEGMKYNWYFNHTEMQDDKIFLFADYLPAGVYEYEYLVRATTSGKFLYRPTRIWEMYTPENFGQTWGGWIEIKDEN